MTRRKSQAKASRNAKDEAQWKASCNFRRRQRRRRKRRAALDSRDTNETNANGSKTVVGHHLQQLTSFQTSDTSNHQVHNKDSTLAAPSSLEEQSDLGNSDSLRIHGNHQRPLHSFNPSTIHDHDAGEEGLPLADVYPRKGLWIDQDSRGIGAPGEHTEPEYYGVDAVFASDRRDTSPNRPIQQVLADNVPKMSLSAGYANQQELGLGCLGVVTLSLAGQIAKQLALEATYDFLKNCIPAAERNQFWHQIVGTNDSQNDTTTSLSIRKDTIDIRGGKRSINLLLSYCITTLNSSFKTHDDKMLRAVFIRAIVLCDALDDTRRRDALYRTLNTLDRLVLSLAAEETQLYRYTSRVIINEYETQYPPVLDKRGQVALSQERHAQERDLLQRYKETYDGFKQSFKKEVVESLQRLIATA